MRTFLRTLAVGLIAAIAAPGVAAGPALAEEGDVTWTVRTASNSYGTDRSSYSYALNPGGTVKDAMVVANRGKKPVTLTVYAADGFTTDAGQLDVRLKGTKSTGLGAWAKPAQESVTVAAGKVAQIPFTLSIPANATPGDYVGGLLTSLTRASTTENINVDRRLGIRIKLRVGGELRPVLAVEDLKLAYHGTWNPFGEGSGTITYTIRNSGNAILSAQQAAAVTGPFGWFSSDAAAIVAAPELLPGETWAVEAPVAGITPAFRATATTTLNPLVTDLSGSTSRLDPVTAEATTWAIPWALLALIVLVAAVVVLVILLVRRQRAHQDARVQKAVDEALASAK
jgi:hypothetical protein